MGVGETGVVCEYKAMWSPRSNVSIVGILFKFDVNPVSSGSLSSSASALAGL